MSPAPTNTGSGKGVTVGGIGVGVAVAVGGSYVGFAIAVGVAVAVGGSYVGFSIAVGVAVAVGGSCVGFSVAVGPSLPIALSGKPSGVVGLSRTALPSIFVRAGPAKPSISVIMHNQTNSAPSARVMRCTLSHGGKLRNSLIHPPCRYVLLVERRHEHAIMPA